MSLGRRLTTLGEWVLLGAAVGVVCGSASALFLDLLDWATQTRLAHPALPFALPLAGGVLGLFHGRLGQAIAPGNNLVIDTLHDGGPRLPWRLAPMVMGGTVLTHLFGGSAGREGTAVQMGAGLADGLAHCTPRLARLRHDFLLAGVAGGFGSVFGTPVAGALFAMEFVVLGQIDGRALAPALVASVVADMVTRALGVTHTAYPTPASVALTPLLLAKWLVFAAAVAVVATVFIELTHRLKRWSHRLLPRLHWRTAAGGAVLVLLWQGAATDIYLGLGVPTIVRAFTDPSLPPYAFAAKLLFTAVTLSVGFVGGEVTPLFFVGAALGNCLAPLLNIDLTLAAAVGMAAVFAAAANTPLALSVMAVELVGSAVLPHGVIVATVAYVLAGHRGIYPAQRLRRSKSGALLGRPVALRDVD